MAAFPLTATSIEESRANENTTLFVVRGRLNRLSMIYEDLRGILLATDGSHSCVLWLTDPPLHVRHPCNHLLNVRSADANVLVGLPTLIPELIECRGRTTRSRRSSQPPTTGQSQSQMTNASQVTDASVSQSTNTWHHDSEGEEETPMLTQPSNGNDAWDCDIRGHAWNTQLSIAGAYDDPPCCTMCGLGQDRL